MADILLIQSSLRKDSRTAVVVEETARVLRTMNINHEIIDLRDYTIPFCDGRSLSEYFAEFPDVTILHEKMVEAKSYIIAYPVYLYTISGVLKNFLDIFAGPTEEKFFGIIANAGGKNNYMSSNDLINFMLYDMNSTAIMPQVYTSRSDFNQEVDGSWTLIGAKPIEKIVQMVKVLLEKIPKEEKILGNN